LLREALSGKLPAENKFVKEDFESTDKAVAKTKALIKWYKESGKPDSKLSAALGRLIKESACHGIYWQKFGVGYELGTTEAILRESVNYLGKASRNTINRNFNKYSADFDRATRSITESTDKEQFKRANQVKLELQKCLSILK
jgi:hypothetical protein